MIQFGQPFGFNGFHNVGAPPTATTSEAGATHVTVNNNFLVAAAPVAMPVAVMSPAYMMAYPQMAQGGMGYEAMGAGAGGSSAGGHVTANPTNSMAQPAYGQGYSGSFGAMPMAMPMMIAPVFFQMGFPMMYPAQAQSPAIQDDAAAVVDPVVAEVPVADVAPPVDDPMPEDVPTAPNPPIIDVVPTGTDDDPPAPAVVPNLPISRLEAADFARYRSIESLRSQTTELSLELRTKDGDSITLEFSQLDTNERFNFKGQTLEGQRMRDSGYTESSERLVNMDVVGELSAEERAAIDNVMSSVLDAVTSFFSGSVGDAVATLKSMDFDTSTLAELSLSMSSTRTAEVNKAYLSDADASARVIDKDADITKALEFIASEQKRLVDVAKSVLDDPSAARLVRELMPPLMSAPLLELADKIENAEDQTDEVLDELQA